MLDYQEYRSPHEKTVIIHSRRDEEGKRDVYFFSTDHCQESRDETYPKGQGFVPCTFYLPQSVVPRPELPSGVITNLKDLLLIFYKGAREIPNPNPKFQPHG